MRFFMDVIRGVLIGVANVIPGVSGGTMAVSLGVYDRLISSLTGLFKNFKRSMQTLVPILLGAALGIVGFAFLIEYLFATFPLATCLTFTGLILGGLPILTGSLKKELEKRNTGIKAGHVAAFVILFVFGIGMSLAGGEGAAVDLSRVNVIGIILLFVIGMVTSATMVIPGVSGSMLLMILGYYNSIISAITDFMTALKDFDVPGLLHGVSILMPFGIGVVVGIFLIAKLIEFLFNRYAALTYSAILGLIISSPFAIFINMGAVQLRPAEVIAGVLLLAAGAVLTWKVGDEK
ncbi:MAG: DUF368 domain-containing protein [Lachnospiraceae bacterium]|nr:DUF368 domain-containing protein [Lachnospiraceae bacterium]